MIDTALLLPLIGFAFVASITPGPNNLLLMSSGALFGWRRTLPHVGGIQIGFAALIGSAVLGLGAVIQAWPWLLMLVKSLGAAWLTWMSLKFLKTGISRPAGVAGGRDAPISRPFRLYEAALFQWINPKGLVAAVSAAGAFIAISDSLYLRTLLIVGAFFLSSVISCLSWTMAGQSLHRLMAEGPLSSWLNIGMGLLILATAIYIVIA